MNDTNRKKVLECENLYGAYYERIGDIAEFDEKEAILKNINMRVYEGDYYCIIGQSGAGKSVLMKHLIRNLVPARGNIYFHGKDITYEDWEGLENFRLRKGVVFQGGALYAMNVKGNLQLWFEEHNYGLSKSQLESLTIKSLELVGLDFKEVANKTKSQLSGGMQKRVAIAREIIHEPEIIIYDEPTSGLDPISCDNFYVLSEQLHKSYNLFPELAKLENSNGNRNKKRTTLVITHDIPLIETISENIKETRIGFMYHGQLFEYNSFEELKNSSDIRVKRFLNPREYRGTNDYSSETS